MRYFRASHGVSSYSSKYIDNKFSDTLTLKLNFTRVILLDVIDNSNKIIFVHNILLKKNVIC